MLIRKGIGKTRVGTASLLIGAVLWSGGAASGAAPKKRVFCPPPGSVVCPPGTVSLCPPDFGDGSGDLQMQPDGRYPSLESPLQQPLPAQNLPQQPSNASPFQTASATRTVAPNMIGDFFGSGASMLTVGTAQIQSFAGTYNFNNVPTQFPYTTQPDLSVQLLATTSQTLNPFPMPGDATSTIPAGTIWQSAPGVADSSTFLPPSSFPLLENPTETAATQAAFPTAQAVIFNSGQATQDGPTAYNIFTNYSIIRSPPVLISIPSPSAGGGGAVVGRTKIAENGSPIPRDRIYFNYSYFNNVPLQAGGVSVNRVTPGIEKTFFNGMASFEFRAPFATTLSTDITTSGLTNTDKLEFGNITTYFKALLAQSSTFAVSTGMGVQFPTADNINLSDAAGTDILKVTNRSIHLLPFLGMLWTPNERWFTQSFMQYDVDTNGNPVALSSFAAGLPTGALSRIGTANDSTFLYYSLSSGYWLYLNPGSPNLTGFAPMIEMHYNKSLQTTDVISSAGYQVGNYADNVALLNGVVGMTALFGSNKSLTAGYSVPIGGGNDQQFDGEYRMIFNWYFGPGLNRQSRVQF